MILGIAGKAGAGKSHIAGLFTQANSALGPTGFQCVLPISLAGPIKDIARDHFFWDGVKDEKGRALLQLLGTECGRHYRSTIWLDTAAAKINKKQAQVPGELLVIIDDIRFDNEALFVMENGGCVVMLHGRELNLANRSQHASEAGVDAKYITARIDNSPGANCVESAVDEILRGLVKKREAFLYTKEDAATVSVRGAPTGLGHD